MAVLLDLGESLVVALDVVRGFGARDPQALGEPEGALTIDDAEVHRLGDRAHLARDLVAGQVEEAGGGLGVDVGAAGECVRKTTHAAAQVGEDPELDLGVIRRQQQAPGRGHEGAANAPALGGPHRDVLHIGVGGGEAAGRRRGLREVGVDAPGFRVDELGQGVDIGVLELDQ